MNCEQRNEAKMEAKWFDSLMNNESKVGLV
jgi:hypothetical protein